MRALVQRASTAKVVVDGEVVGAIGPGLCVFVAITHSDTAALVPKMATKITGLRIFDDEHGVMNRSLLDVAGELLVVSQFTLYGDTRKGRRPGYSEAARPEHAEPIVDALVAACRASGVTVATGRFRADMKVTLTNDGPVTLLLEL